MPIPSRATVTWLVLILWVVGGPLAATLGACAAMGAMCEGPCGVGPGVVQANTSGLALALMASVMVPGRVNAPPGAVRVVELPPKSAPSFA